MCFVVFRTVFALEPLSCGKEVHSPQAADLSVTASAEYIRLWPWRICDTCRKQFPDELSPHPHVVVTLSDSWTLWLLVVETKDTNWGVIICARFLNKAWSVVLSLPLLHGITPMKNVPPSVTRWQKNMVPQKQTNPCAVQLWLAMRSEHFYARKDTVNAAVHKRQTDPPYVGTHRYFSGR